MQRKGTDGGYPPTTTPKKARGSLTLNTIKSVRMSIAKVIRKYNAGEIPLEKYKGLIYGLSMLAHMFKTEFEMLSDERIAKIEKAIAEIQRGER